MYKWVDEKGITHYSESAPPEGTKGVAKVEVKTTTPDRPPVDNWRERELESKQQKAMKAGVEEVARQKEEQQRGQKCGAAQRRAEIVKSQRRVYSLNEKGERVYLEDKDREAALKEANENIARYCR